MSDPTLYVITIAFGSAIGLFAIGAGIKQMMQPSIPVDAAPGASVEVIPESSAVGVDHILEDPSSPYTTPQAPPPTPWARPTSGEKVPTTFYNPFDLLGLGFIFLLFFALTVMNIKATEQKDMVVSPIGLLVSIGFQFMIAGGVMATVISRIHPVDWLGLKWKKWPWVFLIAPLTVLGLLVMMGALDAAGYIKWIESQGVETVQEAVKLLQKSNDPLVVGLMIIAAVIVAPMCEELVFRGYLYPLAKKYSGPWIGGLFSAIIFGCAHGNLAALLPLTVFGIVMAAVYQKTGSLWSTIAIHFCFNGLTVAVQMLSRYHHFAPDSSF